MSIYTSHQAPWNWENCTRNSQEAEWEFSYMLRNIQSWEDEKNGTLDWLFDDHRSWISIISDSLRDRTAKILELWCWNGEFLNMLSSKWFKSLVWIDVRPRLSYDPSKIGIEILQHDFSNIDDLWDLHWKFDIVYSKLIFDSYRYKAELRRWAIRSAHRLLKEWWLYYCLWPHDLGETASDTRSIVPRQHTLIQWAINYIPAEK